MYWINRENRHSFGNFERGSCTAAYANATACTQTAARYTHAFSSTHAMARRFCTSAVASFFAGEDSEGLTEIIFEGSDDELGMDDELTDDSEPEFEPLEMTDEGKHIYI